MTCGCDGQRSRNREGPILSVSSIISIIVAFTGRVLWFLAIVVIEKIPVTSLWKVHTACNYCARPPYCGAPVRPNILTMLNSVWGQSQYRVEVLSTWVNLYDVKLGLLKTERNISNCTSKKLTGNDEYWWQLCAHSLRMNWGLTAVSVWGLFTALISNS